MTKEDILEAVALDIFSLEQILDEFFSQNVVIPRGENRVAFADVWHQAIEGVPCELWSSNDDRFMEVYLSKEEIRIKPSEPVYEYQYMLFGKGVETYNHCYGISIGYATDNEIDEEVYRWVKIEETKRERLNHD